MKLFNTTGNTPITFTQANSGGLIPGQSGPLSDIQLQNLNANDFKIQAAPDGSQTAFQSMLFNKPTFGQNGVGQAGGLNLDGIGGMLEGIGSAVSIFQALKSIGLAKEQMNFQKDAFNTNMANQKKSYNTALEDRIGARYKTEGRSSQDVDAYLAKHSM